ncbi:MAG TPA: fatty acid desaturase [Chlamydiales bacterium]|nr:fatty acid desaturase [Chlamydiales bacterium]
MTKKICWPVILFILGYHLFLLIALPLYFIWYTPSLALVLITVALVFISGMSITSGYHRLYSHTCYKVHPVVEAILLFFGTLATQGSALRWAHDHRLHHAFVDTDKDPYSVKKGLFHAHVLWMFFKSKEIDPKVIADLSRSKMLQFQHKYYAYCMVAANLIVFLAVGWLLNDYVGAFLFAWWVRMLFLHHTTWCINSLAHYWGTKMYSQEHSAVDNYLISLLTYGEGYHNYHHTFAYDYRNGIRWYHFDPAKWLIWTLNKLGLAYDLKRVNNYRIARELVLEHKNRLISAMKNSFNAHKENWEQKVVEISTNLTAKLTELQSLLEKCKTKDREIRSQVRAMKKSLKNDWKEWRSIVKSITKVIPIEV